MPRDAVFALLQSADKPLKESDLPKMAKAGGIALRKKDLASLLDDLVSEGRVFKVSVSAKSSAYTTQSPRELARTALGDIVSQLTGPATPARLRSKLPAYLRSFFDEALGELVHAGQAHYLPKGKSRQVLNRPLKPSDILTPANIKSLNSILAKTNRYASRPSTIEDLLAWLDGADSKSVKASPPKEPSIAEFRQWYEEDSKHTSSRMVSVLDTWKHFQAWAASQGTIPEPSCFRDALKKLHDQGLVFLEPPERPQDLSPEVQLLLVPQTLGPPALRWCWTSAVA